MSQRGIVTTDTVLKSPLYREIQRDLSGDQSNQQCVNPFWQGLEGKGNTPRASYSDTQGLCYFGWFKAQNIGDFD